MKIFNNKVILIKQMNLNNKYNYFKIIFMINKWTIMKNKRRHLKLERKIFVIKHMMNI